MKLTHTAAKAAVIAAILLGLFQAGASAAIEPIPGVDVIVKKDPGGKAIKATTDKAGTFVFANLEAGKYVLTVTPPQTKLLVNTTHSNIRHHGITMVKGVEVASVSVTLGAGAPEPVEIVFTKSGGKIAGTVVVVVEKTEAPAKDAAKAK